jgi:putative inorganic carbon (HCO3(-)) transporter
MTRLLFVLCLIAVGTYLSLQAPFYALLFYIGNAYFRPEEWVWSEVIRSLHLSVLIGSYVVIVSLLSKHKFIFNGRVCLIVLFLLQSVLATAVSDHAEYCWPFLIEFIKVAVITYLIVVLTTDFKKFRLVLLVMVLGLGLEQAKQGWFYLLTSPGGSNTNSIPFLGDNNGVAVGMLMLVPLTGVLVETADTTWAKFALGGVLVGCFYRALSTYSRGGILAAIALGAIWWLRSFQKMRVAAGIIVMLFIVTPVLPDAFWKRMNTIDTYEENNDPSALGRLHYWSVALSMAKENPSTGIGFNGFNIAYDTFDSSDGLYGQGRSVHNSFFGVLAELGYPGLFLYITILLCAFFSCEQLRRLASHREIAIEFGKSAVALETSLVVFVVGGSFVPFQYNEMLWHIIGLTIALRQIGLKDFAMRPLFSSTKEIVARELSVAR